METSALNIPGNKAAFIGIGGGSDCIQASILAILSGKPACVLSIRANKTSSQGNSGQIGEERTVNNHGGEVARGVVRILPETTGSGRFLESIPAGKLPVYLVIDYKDGKLHEQIQSALNDFGGVDTVIGIDTGGDSLYRTTVSDATKATPDQDLESLKAICRLEGQSVFSYVVAKGIDSPDYADHVLSQARAIPINFLETEKQRILDLYAEFEMDGSHPDRYGKTPFAWQAALRGETGTVRLPLPEKIINDPRNPWNPYVNVTPEMARCYVMRAEDHLNAITQPSPVSALKPAPPKFEP